MLFLPGHYSFLKNVPIILIDYDVRIFSNYSCDITIIEKIETYIIIIGYFPRKFLNFISEIEIEGSMQEQDLNGNVLMMENFFEGHIKMCI